MDSEGIQPAAYRGTRQYTQQEARTAEATSLTAATDDYAERGIDLNEQLVRNKPATFFMRVRGDAMVGAGIFDGDVVVVDRSLKPVSGRVVIATLNGEMLIRRLEQRFNRVRLVPETARLAAIDIDPEADFSVWGVVTYAIHAL